VKLFRILFNESDREIINKILTFMVFFIYQDHKLIKHNLHAIFESDKIINSIYPVNNNEDQLFIPGFKNFVQLMFNLTISFYHPSFDEIPVNSSFKGFFRNTQRNLCRGINSKRTDKPYNLKDRSIKDIAFIEKFAEYLPAAEPF